METMNRKRRAEWTEIFPVEAALAARRGLSDPQIAALHGLTPRTLAKWKQERPILRQALALARDNAAKGHAQRFEQHVLESLPPRLQHLWRQLVLWQDDADGFEKTTRLLAGKKKLVRQQLFAQAMIYTGFNLSKAAAMTNLPLRTYREWLQCDPEFIELMEWVRLRMQDFFENALLKLVAEGNPNAIIFANRTLNKGRGYGDKPALVAAGQFEKMEEPISVEELDLPVKTLRELLDAVRAAKAKRTNAGKQVA